MEKNDFLNTDLAVVMEFALKKQNNNNNQKAVYKCCMDQYFYAVHCETKTTWHKFYWSRNS